MSTPETSDETSTPEPSDDSPRRPGAPGRRPEKKDMHTEGSTPPPPN